MKKSLSAAFSTKALAEQEHIIQQCVEGFIWTIGLKGTEKALNMSDWFGMISFDILGEMAFGESFHRIENGKPHFWTEIVMKHVFFITLMDNLRRFAFLSTLGRRFLPRWTVAIRNKHSSFSREKVASRLDSKTSRKDFMTNLVGKIATGEVSREEMTAHASSLIIAGGETVSTVLAAVLYYLLTNPETYIKLRQEIRTRYSSYDEIDATSSLQLPCLKPSASTRLVRRVFREYLRVPPWMACISLPELVFSPTMSETAFKPDQNNTQAEVYASAWTVMHDPQYFHEPFQFKPERWIDPTCPDTKEASQPFSLGPRGCLGRKLIFFFNLEPNTDLTFYLSSFAWVQIALLMAKLHWRYDLDLVDKNLDWEGQSHMHVIWWKPALDIRFSEAP
ncbi:hypothetical protein MMC29_004319 [Sticta canariensis]|nr:hypothetical protein [Sticta canariensis]